MFYPLKTKLMRKKILLIDDEAGIRETLTDILELKGYEVKIATNGKLGFDMVMLENPDIILCDVMMPQMTGYEMLETIRKSQGRRVPFIFLTAKGRHEDFRTGMDLGADDYLLKPVDSAELFQVIDNQLTKYELLFGTGQLEEKKRLGRDLHDTLQQTLIGIHMRLTGLREKVIETPFLPDIDKSLEYIKLAFLQLRMILFNKSDRLLEEEGLESVLNELIRRVSQYVNFNIRLQNNLDREIPIEQAQELLSIIFEMLNNVIKHASAKNLAFLIEENDSIITLTACDDGCGFDVQKAIRTNGLKNVSERSEKLGGKMSVESEIGKGTTIKISFRR